MREHTKVDLDIVKYIGDNLKLDCDHKGFGNTKNVLVWYIENYFHLIDFDVVEYFISKNASFDNLSEHTIRLVIL